MVDEGLLGRGAARGHVRMVRQWRTQETGTMVWRGSAVAQPGDRYGRLGSGAASGQVRRPRQWRNQETDKGARQAFPLDGLRCPRLSGTGVGVGFCIAKATGELQAEAQPGDMYGGFGSGVLRRYGIWGSEDRGKR